MYNSNKNIPRSVKVSTLQLAGITSYGQKYAKTYERTPKRVVPSRGSHCFAPCSMLPYFVLSFLQVPHTASLCGGEYTIYESLVLRTNLKSIILEMKHAPRSAQFDKRPYLVLSEIGLDSSG